MHETMSFSNSAQSTQQPYAQPQPSPIPYTPAHQNASLPTAASPPTKRDLKSWWKGFKSQKSQDTQEPSPGIFGVPLKQSIQYANVAISLVDAQGKSYIYGYVPIVVAKCGVYLKEKATNVEGIFRLSGSEKRIKELRTLFDSPDRYGKGLDWDGYTVHDAANVLRRYLNQLPEPIVPLDLYDKFRDPYRDLLAKEKQSLEDLDKIIQTYQQLITELPPLNRQLLLYILDLLAVFASKSDENRMNSANLAAIFQPGMLSHPQHDMAPGEYRLSQDVLVFLIENQDHFLIGMRGTAADEQTVHDVQKGGTPPPATPTSTKKSGVVRSASTASAGADSIRRQGGVRRNVSVNSRHSKQSTGAPSPASPALQPLTTTSTGNGVHRSNTVPSKRSMGISTSRLQRSPQANSTMQSTLATPTTPSEAGLSLFKAPLEEHRRSPLPPSPPSNVTPVPVGATFSTPSVDLSAGARSQERLLPALETPENNVLQETPKNERPFFLRTISVSENDKRPPNKLRKKRIPDSSNPSAQSSSTSLPGQSGQDSLGFQKEEVVQGHSESLRLESIITGEPLHATSPGPLAPSLSNTDATPPVISEQEKLPSQDPGLLSGQSDGTLKPQGSANSLRSGELSNDQSDFEHFDDPAVISEQKEKRRMWRLSRRPKEDKKDEQTYLTPSSPSKKSIGGNNGAETSTTSFNSGRARKSFQHEPMPNLDQLTSEASNGSGSKDDKKGPMDWFKSKLREAKEEKRERDAERDRERGRLGSEQWSSGEFARGKSSEYKREAEIPEVREVPKRAPLE